MFLTRFWGGLLVNFPRWKTVELVLVGHSSDKCPSLPHWKHFICALCERDMLSYVWFFDEDPLLAWHSEGTLTFGRKRVFAVGCVICVFRSDWLPFSHISISSDCFWASVILSGFWTSTCSPISLFNFSVYLLRDSFFSIWIFILLSKIFVCSPCIEYLSSLVICRYLFYWSLGRFPQGIDDSFPV